jgi:FAD/FMN-containing dehydrogenase
MIVCITRGVFFMNRRTLLSHAATISLLQFLRPSWSGSAQAADRTIRRVRPPDVAWPDAASWERLGQDVGGHLIKVQPLLAGCASGTSDAACQDVLAALKNPYYVGDQPAGTQTAGWVDAWMSKPSVYAVAARTSEDVVAAVNFSRDNKLRLVVKGGGHSYQGTSDSADSLLIWTRAMNDIVLHDAFVAQGCAGTQAAQPAVTVGAGVIWMHAYDAVTTKAGRYVQGGGCATVGVAGLIQSGGFGSFSKNYGTASGGLLEAEIVTADGQLRIANACSNPDLFWGIKGGGGGSLGVITKLTLRTRELPSLFGGVHLKIRATSDAAFRRLVGRFVNFYADNLLNPHWGESISFGADNTFAVTMVFQGLDQPEAERSWRQLMDWVEASPGDFTVTSPLAVHTIPGRDWWNAEFLRNNPKKSVHGQGSFDQRPGAPADNYWFEEQNTELGIFIHGFQSLWLPASLLKEDQQSRLADALFAATRQWEVALHFNKGLAGADPKDVTAAQDTAMNPAVLTAFALVIIAGGDPGTYADLLSGPPDLAIARKHAASIAGAADELRKVVPDAGSYLSESNFFERDWQSAFWGANYPRLREVKRRYDPEGLFFVHHGVGSEEWSADGFTRQV